MIPRFNDSRDWFFHHRFGLFIHWGLYSINAFHEQEQWRLHVPSDKYVKLVEKFNPRHFDPYQWVSLCRDVGMDYICFTCKHHDGFCMWNSKHSDYNIMNTPYRKDILAELATACHKHGIRLGLYYSCPYWHHPAALNFGATHQLEQPKPGDSPDLLKYLDYVYKQVEELCSNYGEISQFFWDIPQGIKFPPLNDLIRKLQPSALINNRGYGAGDYDTPERFVPELGSFTKATEACQSVGSSSWGYRKNEDYFTPLFLMQSIDKIMAMGGNYLLNVGPDSDGRIPEESANILRKVGDWYKKVKEAFSENEIYKLPEHNNEEIIVTQRENTLYLHFTKGLQKTGYAFPALKCLPEEAVLLNNGKRVSSELTVLPQIAIRSPEPRLRIFNFPTEQMAEEVPIVKLVFKQLPP